MWTSVWLLLLLAFIRSYSISSTINTKDSNRESLHQEVHPEYYLSFQSFEGLFNRLQLTEWLSMRWKDSRASFLPTGLPVPSNTCPVELKPVFGSCCMNGLSTKLNDYRTSCFADLVSNYRLLSTPLPNDVQYKTMLDVFRLFSSSPSSSSASQDNSQKKSKRRTVVWQMIGDSIQLQVANGMQCSHHRNGVFSNHTIMQEIISSTSTKKIKYEWLYGPKASAYYEVDYDDLVHRFNMTRMYRPPFEHDHVDQMETLLLQGDVIMLNFGLHYRWKEKALFYQHMKVVLQSVQAISRQYPDKIMLWRENSAQHHNAPGGEFSIAYLPNNNGQNNMSPKTYKALFSKCSNATSNQKLSFSASITKKWREDVILNISREIGLDVFNLTDLIYVDRASRHYSKGEVKNGRMYIVPFFDYTERFGNLHPYKPNRENTLEAVVLDKVTGDVTDLPSYNDVQNRVTLELQGKYHELVPKGDLYMTCDPTHFCYSPLFWQPWIHQLYLMMEKILS